MGDPGTHIHVSHVLWHTRVHTHTHTPGRTVSHPSSCLTLSCRLIPTLWVLPQAGTRSVCVVSFRSWWEPSGQSRGTGSKLLLPRAPILRPSASSPAEIFPAAFLRPSLGLASPATQMRVTPQRLPGWQTQATPRRRGLRRGGRGDGSSVPTRPTPGCRRRGRPPRSRALSVIQVADRRQQGGNTPVDSAQATTDRGWCAGAGALACWEPGPGVYSSPAPPGFPTGLNPSGPR